MTTTFESSDGAPAVHAENFGGGFGVVAISNSGGKAIEGRTDTGTAVVGTATTGTAVVGVSEGFGIVGVSSTGKAIEGRTSTGTAIIGVASDATGRAGLFDGNVEVTRDLILTGADVAEQFDVAAQARIGGEVDPGAVVVLDGAGAVMQCTQQYDRSVAGVVSGAGDRVPALILDRQEPREADWRRAIAVIGKVWCRADACSRPIRVGDLLTTSSTPGHAMTAVDREAAFGAVFGKALTSLSSGTGMVLVLVGLG